MTNSIYIGPSKFSINYCKGDAAQDEGNLGYCSVQEHEIVVSKYQDRSSKHSIIIHESIEAMNTLYDIELTHHQINLLETLFYDFIKSNEHFIEDIQQTTSEE